MALPLPGAGRRGLVSFTILGFPVNIHASFVVAVVLLNLGGGAGLTGALVGLAVVVVSVIAHELGHALVAAPVGGNPRIDLFGIAGLTRWDSRGASRARLVAVSLAGPGAGVAFGLGVAALWHVLDPPQGTLLDRAFLLAVLVNVAWGVVNLLPMLPLDGGHVLREVMPGRDPTTRLLRASYVSVAVGVLTAGVTVRLHEPYLAALVVFFGAGNVQTLMAIRAQRRGLPNVDRVREIEVALARDPAEALALLDATDLVVNPNHDQLTMLRALAQLRLDRAREAQQTLLTLPGVDRTLAATVLYANGQERLAREQLTQSLPYAPRWAVRELAALLLRRGEDVEPVAARTGPSGLVGVAAALHEAGRFREAAEYGERAVAAGLRDPLAAYDLARAWSRVGDGARAARTLDLAASLGWADAARTDADDDLATARAEPVYAEVRARIAANAPARQ